MTISITRDQLRFAIDYGSAILSMRCPPRPAAAGTFPMPSTSSSMMSTSRHRRCCRRRARASLCSPRTPAANAARPYPSQYVRMVAMIKILPSGVLIHIHIVVFQNLLVVV